MNGSKEITMQPDGSKRKYLIWAAGLVLGRSPWSYRHCTCLWSIT